MSPAVALKVTLLVGFLPVLCTSILFSCWYLSWEGERPALAVYAGHHSGSEGLGGTEGKTSLCCTIYQTQPAVSVKVCTVTLFGFVSRLCCSDRS